MLHTVLMRTSRHEPRLRAFAVDGTRSDDPLDHGASVLSSRRRRNPSTRAHAMGALALGAVALGTLAVGAVAIGKVLIGRARIQRLEIGERVVGTLRVSEVLDISPKPGPEA
jgi:hypothetical protein